jgi:Phosphotransferase enzyme family
MNRDLIDRLLFDDPIPPRLGPGGPWHRVYGRNSPAGIDLVYEGVAGAADARGVFIASDGQPIFRSWRNDPALPALVQVKQRHPGAVPVRYRPGKRCTMRMDQLFLKCVADQRGAQIDRDARLLWKASGEGQLGFGVARPRGWLPTWQMIVQQRVPGAPVVDRLWSAEGTVLAGRLGAANATLARATIPVSPRFAYADQLQRTAKYVRRLAKWLPAAEALTTKVQLRLADARPGRADRLIHGAPHAHQWLDGPQGAMLVDFDRFSLGDPELDAATFVAEADFEDSRHAAAAGQAYLAGFDQVHALDPRLVQAYRVHKHVAKALRTATAIRADAAERALEILAGANRMMEKSA